MYTFYLNNIIIRKEIYLLHVQLIFIFLRYLCAFIRKNV